MTPANLEDRPRSEKVHRQVLTIMSLALRVPRQIADVHVDFSAHVGLLSVQIHPQGYDAGLQSVCMEAYMDDPEGTGLGRHRTPLSKILATVKALLMQGNEVVEIAGETLTTARQA